VNTRRALEATGKQAGNDASTMADSVTTRSTGIAKYHFTHLPYIRLNPYKEHRIDPRCAAVEIAAVLCHIQTDPDVFWSHLGQCIWLICRCFACFVAMACAQSELNLKFSSHIYLVLLLLYNFHLAPRLVQQTKQSSRNGMTVNRFNYL
jgi:hypothetical protein